MVVREMATETREVMTVEQVAEYLQLEPEDVRTLIDERELPAFETVPGEWRVDRAALRRWIDRRIAEHCVQPLGGKQGYTEGPARVLSDPPLMTNEWLDRIRGIRERVLEERGGKPFPKGWIREAISEGRM